MITGLDCYDSFGDPYTVWDEMLYMGVWNVPKYIQNYIPVLPTKIYCNKEMVIPLETAFLNVINLGLQDEVKTFDGCFNIRAIRGEEKTVENFIKTGQIEKAMIYMSVHSWGVAIDLNAAWNGLGKTPEISEDFVSCFKMAGFDWGGDWKRLDGMHFQLNYIREEAKIYRP